jgi:hypothetical protein
MPTWAWGLMVGFVLVVVLIGFLFMNQVGSSDELTPNQNVVPTAPLAKPTSTSSPTPEVISTNTSQSSSVLPIDIPDLLGNLEVIESDDFSTQTDLWSTSVSGILWETGYVQVEGIPTFETFLSRGPILEIGQRALFLFEYSGADLNVNLLLERGEWNTPDYRRLGINLQKQAVADIYVGTESFWGEPLRGDVMLRAGVTYYVLLSLDAAQGFTAIIGAADNPTSRNVFQQDPAPDWPADEWSVAIQASAGQIRLSRYYLLSIE